MAKAKSFRTTITQTAKHFPKIALAIGKQHFLKKAQAR